MNIYTLYREQVLPISIEEAWKFFSSAANLSKITPKEMQFVIRTKLDDRPVYAGMKIEYTIRPVMNIPLHWITEISEVNAPTSFTDKQLKGPYALWEHTHSFRAVPGGVHMTDEVKYALPLGILGTIAHNIFVRKKLERIFDFRTKTLDQFFTKPKHQ